MLLHRNRVSLVEFTPRTHTQKVSIQNFTRARRRDFQYYVVFESLNIFSTADQVCTDTPGGGGVTSCHTVSQSAEVLHPVHAGNKVHRWEATSVHSAEVKLHSQAVWSNTDSSGQSNACRHTFLLHYVGTWTTRFCWLTHECCTRQVCKILSEPLKMQRRFFGDHIFRELHADPQILFVADLFFFSFKSNHFCFYCCNKASTSWFPAPRPRPLWAFFLILCW